MKLNIRRCNLLLISLLQLYLEDGKVKVVISSSKTPGKVVLDNFDVTYNDGQWHKAMFTVAENSMELTVDDVPMKTTRIISVISGKYFLVGGKRGKRGGFDVGKAPQELSHKRFSF